MSIAVPLYGFGASGGSPNKSTIIVTAPTGSTVTCKMGSTTKTATEKNGVWTFGGLDLGTWTITSTKGGDSATQDVAITRLTVEYVTIVYRITPEFTYTGDYEIVDDSDNPISDFASWKNNWKIRFLTSGTFTVTKLNGWNGQLDVFLVGGGGGGGNSSTQWHEYGKDGITHGYGGGGGGGGYTATSINVSIVVGTNYVITIGAGGAVSTAGGMTSAFSGTANGGGAGGNANGSTVGSPGKGGSNGGNGGSVGAGSTISAGSDGIPGQGTTTREFAEEGATLYAGGGGGGTGYNGFGGTPTINSGGAGGGGKSNEAGTINTGGGGGGGKAGGSGIAIIRNTRGAA